MSPLSAEQVDDFARDWVRKNTRAELCSRGHSDLKLAGCEKWSITPEDACKILDRAKELATRGY